MNSESSAALPRWNGNPADLPPAPKRHRLIDCMEWGENRLLCSCGVRLYPACDMSAASINECFEDHLRDAAPEMLDVGEMMG